MYGDESEFGEIYIIKNFVNGKRYIGQTVQSSQERFSQHIREAYTKGRKEYNYCLSRGIRKYGEESFDYAVLADKVHLDDLDLVEEHYIDMYQSNDPEIGYNVSPGGSNTSMFKEYEEMKPKKDYNNTSRVNTDDISNEEVERFLKEL